MFQIKGTIEVIVKMKKKKDQEVINIKSRLIMEDLICINVEVK